MIRTEQAFMDEMRDCGLDPAETPIADGRLHRIRDRRDKPGKNDLWYRLYDDGFPIGWFLSQVQFWMASLSK
jgi:phage/plasmid primase-like uncharacterized protein